MDIIQVVAEENVTQGVEPEQKIAVGLSACLAGHAVRYNRGHCQSRLCLHTLSEFFHYDTFCPEMNAGFGTPRPTMRLVGDPDKPELRYTKDTGEDLTEQLREGFAEKVAMLEHLDGYILMKNSPSCGLDRIKVYQQNGHPHQRRVSGLFTAALQQRYPQLPIEEEGRLHDPRLYENFILRVYAHHNFRQEVLSNPSAHALIQFHSSYKYVVMAHNISAYKALGRLLAQFKSQSLAAIIEEYFREFMRALAKPATAKNHANTLMHILGYLKTSVASCARRNIVEVIDNYRRGQLPLVTPLILLTHYIDQSGSDYVRMQRYLRPYPEKLGLANHV